MYYRIPINNYIRAKEVRIIDETGKQMGIMPLEEALRISREKDLDLIQVTEKAVPPVCRIGDFGKYLYQQQKKERKIKQVRGELKEIRVGFNISPHDLETKAKSAKKFLEKGDKVKLSMPLRGREKALGNFAKEKINQFLNFLDKIVPIKTERELKREPRGFTVIISKK
ncbi:translation initiation factor IF-3 [Patescibacteria group bacterium]|nr:translation initiation factor IF-3 [Patescibacteria group bacterium]MBU4274556.1 translation initiation factor IF-3 [Patescibacteria group bacterium]MBU4367461.1 translation initiation factor IF-3 [Patescibacteria group bacterium]MBU4461781.1 translation initiation factor IF-3 [Patescibacteria group bacterium]MCG2700165.1 translation initiation factor IF-3 [Candidatus Parcubacteria bacterium]